MSDKTVPHDADEYKGDEATKVDKSHVDRDPLVEEAESDDDEFPNRDEDEFTKRDLKKPKVNPDLQEGNEPKSPPRGEQDDPDDVKPPIDPDEN